MLFDGVTRCKCPRVCFSFESSVYRNRNITDSQTLIWFCFFLFFVSAAGRKTIEAFPNDNAQEIFVKLSIQAT